MFKNDPKYMDVRGKDVKVAVDDRFKKVLIDDDFKYSVQKDIRGQAEPVLHDEKLNKLYIPEDLNSSNEIKNETTKLESDSKNIEGTVDSDEESSTDSEVCNFFAFTLQLFISIVLHRDK